MLQNRIKKSINFISNLIITCKSVKEQMSNYLWTLIGLLFLLQIGYRGRRVLFHAQNLSKKPFIRALSELSGLDAIFRFLQSALIFVAGEMYLSSTLVYGHGGLTLVGRAYQFDKLSGLLGRSRKLFRLSRARPLSQDLYPTYSTLKGQKCPCSFLEMLFGFMGDICNVSFFITDAYTNLYMVGALTDPSQQIQIDFWANIIWTCSNLFYLLRNLVAYYRLYSRKKITKREKQHLIIDSMRNLLDAVINMSFMMEFILNKKFVGMLGMLASALWLSDYWRL